MRARTALVVQPHAVPQPLCVSAVEFVHFAAAAKDVEMRAVFDVLHARARAFEERLRPGNAELLAKRLDNVTVTE